MRCFIINSSSQAEDIIKSKNLDKEYAPIAGVPEFTKASANLAFGDDNEVVKNGLVSLHKCQNIMNILYSHESSTKCFVLAASGADTEVPFIFCLGTCHFKVAFS